MLGSVKDLEVIQKPTQDAMGVGRFHFSDRYSVFDWGEMPDHIEGKGEALCLMGAYCFEQIEALGVKTHYKGLVDKDGKVVTFSIPWWLMRLQKGDSVINLDGRDMNLEDLKITIEDLEQFGPTLIIDHKSPGGERVLVWSQ